MRHEHHWSHDTIEDARVRKAVRIIIPIVVFTDHESEREDRMEVWSSSHLSYISV